MPMRNLGRSLPWRRAPGEPEAREARETRQPLALPARRFRSRPHRPPSRGYPHSLGGAIKRGEQLRAIDRLGKDAHREPPE